MSYGLSRGRHRVSELTHIAPIKPGFVREAEVQVRYADRLRLMLEASNAREDGGFPSAIRLFRGIHTAQWALIDADTRLLLNVVFDGDLHDYLRALAWTVPHLLELIWSNCVGWRPVHGDPDRLISFIESYQVRVNFLYVHHPQLTVPDVERLVALDETLGQGAQPSRTLRQVEQQLTERCEPRSNARRLQEALGQVGAEALVRSRQAFGALLKPYYAEAAVRGALVEAYGSGAATPSADRPEPVPAVSVDFAQLRAEVQGNVMEPYADASCARMLFLRFPAARPARAWLDVARQLITHADQQDQGPPGLCVNIGLTYAGLEALGLDRTQLMRFSLAFRQGMSARREQLGDPTDVEASRPWTRNLDPSGAIHAVLFVHVAQSHAGQAMLEQLSAAGALAQARAQRAAGAASRGGQSNAAPCLGVSQAPHALLSSELGAVLDRACARLGLRESDFVGSQGGPVYLGHQDLHKPLVQMEASGASYGVEYFGFRDGIAQPQLALGPEPTPPFAMPLASLVCRDGLQRYGSFLVARQLRQHPEAFWTSVAERAQALGVSARELAERIVGRRMDGRRLDSDRDSFDPLRDAAAFDPGGDGRGCPFHSHVRRLNPRIEDSPVLNPPLMRRSLAYVGERGSEHVEGMMFLALNADVETQFEFIQRKWLQSGDRAGLPSDARDVLTGLASGSGPAGVWAGELERDAGEPPVFAHERFERAFVSLEWGAYLFLPGRSALAALAQSADPKAGV